MTLVLNTRPLEQASELTSLLRGAGFSVVEAPAIAIEPAWDTAELQRVVEALRSGRYAWIVLPSPNAGRALAHELTPARLVCGTSTARALSLSSAIALHRFSAAAALAALSTRLRRGDRVLVPRAAEGRDELIEGLQALGAEVDAPIAYRTVCVEDAANRLRAGGIDIVTVCSPSAARCIAAAVRNELVVCLGETTASGAREVGLRPTAVAERTSMASLVEAVVNLMGSRV